MDHLQAFLQDNWVGIVVGVISIVALQTATRVLSITVKFVRTYGFRKLGQALRESLIHVAAYKKIKADAVLSIGYVAMHLSFLIFDATLCTITSAAALSTIAMPQWAHGVLAAIAIFFALGVAKRALAISFFYAATAGPIIEEEKKNNPLFKLWDNRKKGEPFIQLGRPPIAQPTPPPSATAATPPGAETAQTIVGETVPNVRGTDEAP